MVKLLTTVVTNMIYKYDSNAFIFSLFNKLNKPIKIKCSNNLLAIFCHLKFGPNFGGSNLQINDLSNINTCSNSNLGHLHCDAYNHPDYMLWIQMKPDHF
jgi:hypothetical protein